MAASVFLNTVRRFNNMADPSVRETVVRSSSVGSLLDASKTILRKIDRGTSDSTDLIRRVWRLRTSVLFGVAAFDDPAMALSEQFEAIRSDAARVPDLGSDLESLANSVSGLMREPENPKCSWLLNRLGSSLHAGNPASPAIAVFAAMIGWRSSPSTLRSILPDHITVVESRSQLLDQVFDSIIVLGTCQYLSSRTFTELFHMGCAKRIEVLCYPGEHFVLRERTSLPECQLAKGRLNVRRIAVSRQVMDDHGERDADSELAERLWDTVHDGERSEMPGHVRARYIMFGNDRGFFVPAEEYSALVWRDGGTGQPSLLAAGAEELAENDLLVMQPGDTGRMLDLLSSKAGFEKKLAESCDWRPALERFLLTETPEELAADMLGEGAQGSALVQSIRNWADGSVYGPGQRNELRALLSVLLTRRYLDSPIALEEFVDAHWEGLQEARGIRHRAGFLVRQELSTQVADALKQQGRLLDGQQLNLANGVTLQVHRVVAVDDRVSWVLPSQLLDVKPIRGGRWHA